MSLKFTHYLITRFNVPVNNWNKDKTGKPVLDDAWMLTRLELFSNYCIPTLTHQTETDFNWLIYCDQNTSQKYLDQIHDLISAVPMAQIRLVSDFDALLVDLRNTIHLVATPFVITSRLDNDDGLGPEFIADVQRNFEEQDKRIINFSKGVLYHHNKGVLTEIRNSERNHYGSLIEAVKPDALPLTVVGYPHGIPPEGSRIVNVDTPMAWLKIIHDRNMVSKTNGVPLLRKNVANHFHLNKDAFSFSLWNTFWFVVRRVLSRLKNKLFKS